MKTLVAAALLMSCLLVRPAAAADAAATATAQARQAAEKWLALVDSGHYGQSWDEAASLFKSALTRPDWERTVGSARAPLGALKSRQLESATFTRTLPGAPDGEYVVIRYATRFENKAAAVETITPMHDKDGRWRVSGYFIR
jgi:hypothetical protein